LSRALELEELVDLNATAGQELGLSVEGARAETSRIALGLDVLGPFPATRQPD